MSQGAIWGQSIFGREKSFEKEQQEASMAEAEQAGRLGEAVR